MRMGNCWQSRVVQSPHDGLQLVDANGLWHVDFSSLSFGDALSVSFAVAVTSVRTVVEHRLEKRTERMRRFCDAGSFC